MLAPPWPSPIVADPSTLTPDDSPDGRWHLFAHSLVGIHHWSSADGLRWGSSRLVVPQALRAHVLRTGRRWLLVYEQPVAFVPVGVPWRSRIEVRASADLRRWSPPRVLLEPTLAWHRRGRSAAVSNPCLVPPAEGEAAGEWRLYYSGGLVRVPDCGFDEPAAVGLATGPGPFGPFVAQSAPQLAADPADPDANLAAGAVEVLRVADGYVAFQNAISVHDGRSRSAVRVLTSDDGRVWRSAGPPVIGPVPGTWRGSHLYALCVVTDGRGLRLYANGRDRAHWTRGRERIGLFTADLG